MRRCSKCDIEKPLEDFQFINKSKGTRRGICKPCKAEQRALSSNDPAVREQRRKYQRSFKYGLEPGQYDIMYMNQNGVCAICKHPERLRDSEGHRRPLHVDHDHITGKVRGLLCGPCNRALGLFGDLPQNLVTAEAYLRNGGMLSE